MAATGERELLQMLSAEAERRMGVVIQGVKGIAAAGEGAPELVEALRSEAHALKGAAAVVGQERLAEVSSLIEERLAERVAEGTISAELAARIAKGAKAAMDGARAAADGSAEPPSVADSIAELTR
jgi:HPt (histidine-containing phosphotransfer) domain-containing protein